MLGATGLSRHLPEGPLSAWWNQAAIRSNAQGNESYGTWTRSLDAPSSEPAARGSVRATALRRTQDVRVQL